MFLDPGTSRLHARLKDRHFVDPSATFCDTFLPDAMDNSFVSTE